MRRGGDGIRNMYKILGEIVTVLKDRFNQTDETALISCGESEL